jgi:hypothetical protein
LQYLLGLWFIPPEKKNQEDGNKIPHYPVMLVGARLDKAHRGRNMTRYYMHEGPTAFRFELSGDLDAADAVCLAQDWHAASSYVGERTLIIDVTFVTEIDTVVRSLFGRWHAEGAEFAAGSKRSRELVESITQQPFAHELRHSPTYSPCYFLRSAPLAGSEIPGNGRAA